MSCLSLERIRMHLFHTILLISLPLLSCKVAPPRLGDGKQPIVRVGIVEQRAQVVFEIDENTVFRFDNGSYFIRDAKKGRWKVEAIDSEPARVKYRLAFGSFKDRENAEELMDSIRKKREYAIVERTRLEHPLRIRYAHKATYRVLLNKRFRDAEEAAKYRDKIKEKAKAEVVEIPNGSARGSLRFTHLSTGKEYETRRAVRIHGPEVELADVAVGSGFHWESTETRRYGELVEFLLDFSGNVTVVNHLPLEIYIRGVVPSEMPASFPFEALKAQAVTARVEALAKIGLRHPVEAFDICDDVHCQAFSGLSKRAAESDRATNSTRGIFMIHRDELAEAFYASVCGGHTESNDNVWVMKGKPYLLGGLDKIGKSLNTPLSIERHVKKWIDGRPDVYCNTGKSNVPKSVNYSKRFFRWEVEYGRIELERILKKKTGERFGSLLDLKPVSRGVSGRLIELEIVGSKRKFKIGKELVIRQALSERTLYSACFYVEKKGNGTMPTKFILKGAGWGHGVGMCQVGASVMAHRGKKFDEILTHYYKGVFLEKLYN